MGDEKIEQAEDLVSHVIGPNKKIVNVGISRLTAPGENNLSLVLKVDYLVKNKGNSTEEELNAVAKVMPTLEMMRFVYAANFKSEVAFYDIIVPTLQDFRKEQGVDDVLDLFPRLYTSRANLHGTNDTVDEHAVLLMENLITSGYKNLDRMVGYDLETTKLILKDLAAFHAVPLALKRLRPEIFEEKLSPHFGEFAPIPTANGEKPFNPGQVVIEVLEEREELLQYMSAVRDNLNGFKFFANDPDGLFSSIYHGDLWVNNILTKFENGKPVKNKFVDFQMYMHNSLAKDLFFFLWTSVQQSVLEENLDDLLQIYYDHFIANLKQLKCDTSPFTFEKFLQEITRISKVEFGHTIGMTVLVVFGKRGGVLDDAGNPIPPHLMKKEDVTPEALRRATFMIKECSRRGWLT